MSPRRFNLICVAAVIAVVALTMAFVALGQTGSAEGASASFGQNTGMDAQEAMGLHPLSLGLSLTIVIDMGLMTTGLVILFMEDGVARHRVR